MALNLKGNRLIIRQAAPVDKINGIYLPDSLHTPRNKGTVVAIGDTVDNNFLNKEVLFNLMPAKDFEFGDIKGKLVFTVDVIAILN